VSAELVVDWPAYFAHRKRNWQRRQDARTAIACATIVIGALALCRAAWQLTHLPR
jgi:hypothetical protein